MKKRNMFILISVLLIFGVIFSVIFYMRMSKNLKTGNNTNSQEIINYILNISSYETKIEVEVNSNKNRNKYIIKQEYKNKDISMQEVIEPNNIAGVKITKNGNELKIENTNLNLSSIFENYEYITSNSLDLSSFIEDYKSDKTAYWEEQNNQIIMITNGNNKQKKLYIDKITQKPTKLEIDNINKSTKIYISYNEVNIK